VHSQIERGKPRICSTSTLENCDHVRRRRKEEEEEGWMRRMGRRRKEEEEE
jgi:hypothetical protein